MRRCHVWVACACGTLGRGWSWKRLCSLKSPLGVEQRRASVFLRPLVFLIRDHWHRSVVHVEGLTCALKPPTASEHVHHPKVLPAPSHPCHHHSLCTLACTFWSLVNRLMQVSRGWASVAQRGYFETHTCRSVHGWCVSFHGCMASAVGQAHLLVIHL